MIPFFGEGGGFNHDLIIMCIISSGFDQTVFVGRHVPCSTYTGMDFPIVDQLKIQNCIPVFVVCVWKMSLLSVIIYWPWWFPNVFIVSSKPLRVINEIYDVFGVDEAAPSVFMRKTRRFFIFCHKKA